MKVQPPKWLPEHKEATANLFKLLPNAPRAMADPAIMLLGGNKCFIFQSDDSATGTAQSLHLVHCPEVRVVHIEMLMDPAMSRLVATKHRKKNSSQQNWPSYHLG